MLGLKGHRHRRSVLILSQDASWCGASLYSRCYDFNPILKDGLSRSELPLACGMNQKYNHSQAMDDQ